MSEKLLAKYWVFLLTTDFISVFLLPGLGFGSRWGDLHYLREARKRRWCLCQIGASLMVMAGRLAIWGFFCFFNFFHWENCLFSLTRPFVRSFVVGDGISLVSALLGLLRPKEVNFSCRCRHFIFMKGNLPISVEISGFTLRTYDASRLHTTRWSLT